MTGFIGQVTGNTTYPTATGTVKAHTGITHKPLQATIRPGLSHPDTDHDRFQGKRQRFAALDKTPPPLVQTQLTQLEQAHRERHCRNLRKHFMDDAGLTATWGDKQPNLSNWHQPEQQDRPLPLSRLGQLRQAYPDDMQIQRLYAQEMMEDLIENSIRLEDLLQIKAPPGIDDPQEAQFQRFLVCTATLLNARKQRMQHLGFADPIAFYSEFKGYPLAALEKTVPSHQAQIKPVSRRALHQAVHNSALSFKPSDELMLDKLGETLARQLPGSFMPLPAAKATFDSLGLDWSTLVQEVQPLDTPDGPNKIEQLLQSKHAPILLYQGKIPDINATYPTRIPEEVWVIADTSNNRLNTMQCTLHELGHALHYSLMDPGIPFSQAGLGNHAVTETFGRLLENLMQNQHWLEHVAGLSPQQAQAVKQYSIAKDITRFQQITDMVARQLVLHRQAANAQTPDDLFKILMEHRTNLLTTPANWDMFLDPHMINADVYLSFLLEAGLRRHLEDNFGGESWYQNKDSLLFLKSLGKEGNLSPQELAKRLGSDDMTDITPYLTLNHKGLQQKNGILGWLGRILPSKAG